MPTALALAAVALALLSSPLAAQELVDVAMAGTEMMEDDLPSIASAPDGSAWLVFMAYSDRRDEVAIRQWTDGKWGNLRFVPNTSGDVWLPQAGVDAEGRLWVVWSQMLDGNWDMYARSLNPATNGWGATIRLTDHPLPDINPRLASDGSGNLALAWQGFRNGRSNIHLKTYSAAGGWSEDIRVHRQARERMGAGRCLRFRRNRLGRIRQLRKRQLRRLPDRRPRRQDHRTRNRRGGDSTV